MLRKSFMSVGLAIAMAAPAVPSLAARMRVHNFGPGVVHRFVADAVKQPTTTSRDPREIALAVAKQQHGLTGRELLVTSVVPSTSGTTHVHLRQLVDGIEVVNANMNVSIARDGSVLSFGSSLVGGALAAQGSVVSASAAFQTLATQLGLPAVAPAEACLPDGRIELTGLPVARGAASAVKAYLNDGTGQLAPMWRIELRTEDSWLDAQVAADGSKVVSLIDRVADAAYNVISLTRHPSGGRELITDPAFPRSSPHGWHDTGTAQFTTTQGNNVYAQENWLGKADYLNSRRPDGKADLHFDFPWDKKLSPKDSIEAAITNAFYWTNALHDIFYAYGFDEVAGNFQANNWGKGGKGNDYLIVDVQDGSLTDPVDFATFTTPPDGESPRMRLYVNTESKQDSAFEPDIIVHEYGHGVASRLTGGPMNSGCFACGEAAGMVEGWSDFLAVLLRINSVATRATNMEFGEHHFGKTLRQHPYSTSMQINPTTYATLNQPGWSEAHRVGEVWANILYEMYWNLMEDTSRYNQDWFSADRTAGNTLSLVLVVEAMKLQPCNPTFVQARDALLQAEKALTGGRHQCAIWRAFGKRGVGYHATVASSASFCAPPAGAKAVPRKADTSLPPACKR